MSRSLRLVSFNILEGLRPLRGMDEERRRIDRQRAEAAKQVVSGLDPDILVLNEALFCREHAGQRVDYADLFGFPYEAAALYDGAWGNAILSRHPIARSQELRIYNRGGLTAVIDTPDGQLTVASYHPHPHRQPENKAHDFTQLVAGLAGPLIVCGDLNCISPEDGVDRGAADRGLPRLLEQRRMGRRPVHRQRQAGVRQPRQAWTEGRRTAGGTALFHPHRPHQPGQKLRASASTTSWPTTPSRSLTGEVVHSPASNAASDHHPVMVDFRIRRA